MTILTHSPTTYAPLPPAPTRSTVPADGTADWEIHRDGTEQIVFRDRHGHVVHVIEVGVGDPADQRDLMCSLAGEAARGADHFAEQNVRAGR
jgi:hypothetical protein